MSPAPAAEAPARILVIDDDATVRLHVGELLHRDGYLVEVAGNAAAGVAAARARQPELILLDVMLPDADGFALCRQLRADPATADVPVVFLTARGDGAEVLEGFAAGGVDYIVKPFDIAVLLARVRTHSTLARLSRGLAAALAERTARLEQANRRLREVNLELAMVEERERRRLAEALHDTTIQQLVLARILLDTDLAAGGPPPGDTDRRARDQRLLDLMDLSLRQLRSLVFELSPPVPHQAGLYPALLWLADDLTARWGLPITCSLEGVIGPMSEALTLVLFQGARELLTNAAKHADASQAEVQVRGSDGAVELWVSDDGHGFSNATAAQPAADPARGVGFGLTNLRARVELLGGRLHVASAGHGTRARLWLPLAAADSASTGSVSLAAGSGQRV